ncbi:TPA: GPW/gp25 family protein [Campylobacter jejuni]|uniref:IraD/Gp25-like domain-containing protein n=1 Tax=Campylobacter jejuni TaxID=197 RepID=A0A431EEC3_CAMJU|nr:GPW/gp25 family protein [Campylobacter jejuni]RTJ79607.1 hypothetical protein C3H57_04350 [Campylobacter jejuni]HEG8091743.1 GPW/gp25 family protein [Campylobacter jejuni]HEG8094164.1 GPW/gp25 family protein [Campylobacter jejuni]HEG8097835.1 GPW/gp25 family protein [Campylobacter jejuni]HEG8104641.1 GPW/gp25 family protein [Campylobacter jejuni]
MAIVVTQPGLRELKYSDFPYTDMEIPFNKMCIMQSIETIFSILKGELLNYPEFGTNLRNYLFTQSIANSKAILMDITSVLNEFEPRVTVMNTSDVVLIDRGYEVILNLQVKETLETFSVTKALDLIQG